MKKPPSFKRFLLIMVFLLEGLTLAIVIGFLFAMLDRSMRQEQVSRINDRQAELRIHLKDKLDHIYTRLEEVRHNHNIRISLLLGLYPKIAETVQTLYPQTMGRTFYVRSAAGRYYPTPANGHGFLYDSALLPMPSEDMVQMAVNPYTIVYLMPIIQNDQLMGHAVGVYDLSEDSRFMDHVLAFNNLSIVYEQEEHVKDLFTHQPLSFSSYSITKELTQHQYRNVSDEYLALVIGMKELPSVFLIVDNQQYRQHRWAMVTQLVLLCMPLLVMTFTFSFLILKRVTNELDALAKNALHIAETDGHSDLDATKVRHAEFHYFTQAFNKVLSKVRQRTGDLKKANENQKKQIEERRQMAKALQESEVQLRSLQDNIPIGLFRQSVDGRILFANPKTVSIFRYDSEDEMIQVPFRRLCDDPEQYDQVMDRFDRSENIQNLELRLKRKDGKLMWGAVHLKRTADPKSGDVYIDGALIDITDRKKIEIEKNKLEVQLLQAQKMEALGTLAGGIAHDFNNILFAIIGYCELSLEDAAAGTSQQDNLQQAIIGAHRAAELVQQILTFARQTDIEKHPLNLTLIVKESLKLMRATLPTNIDIRTDLEDNLTVMAGLTQMHQIILNLCTNADHAMRDTGGVLTIVLSKVHIAPGSAHWLTGLQQGGYVRLKIMDTGHGMSTETMERIFDPYFTTKAHGEGTGMGLSMVQGIVRGLNGLISVDSVIGKGSTFDIYLPVVEEMDSAVQQPEKSVIGGREHLLLVDDELLLTSMISQMLSNMGYHVTAHNTPVKALKQFRHAPDKFDLVISDVTMPEMTGPDMIRKMMKIRPGLPVILFTGYSTKINESLATNIGIRALMHKPLTRHELSATIRNVLDSREAA